MDERTFDKLMRLLDLETIEILGDAAFAIEVVGIAEEEPIVGLPIDEIDAVWI